MGHGQIEKCLTASSHYSSSPLGVYAVGLVDAVSLKYMMTELFRWFKRRTTLHDFTRRPSLFYPLNFILEVMHTQFFSVNA